MTNDQNIVRGRHLDSLAADTKRFTLEQNLALNQAIQAELTEATAIKSGLMSSTDKAKLDSLASITSAGANVTINSGTISASVLLNTLSSTVEGAMWIEV